MAAPSMRRSRGSMTSSARSTCSSRTPEPPVTRGVLEQRSERLVAGLRGQRARHLSVRTRGGAAHARRPRRSHREHRVRRRVLSGGFARSADLVAYMASKAAVMRFTDALATETAADGISVFAISRRTVKTEMTAGLFAALWDEPGIWSPPDLAAELIAFLDTGALDALGALHRRGERRLAELPDRIERSSRRRASAAAPLGEVSPVAHCACAPAGDGLRRHLQWAAALSCSRSRPVRAASRGCRRASGRPCDRP